MFNWFRRKKEKPTEEQDKQEKVIDSPTSAESADEPAVESPKTVEMEQENYLNWAKAAFKTIQNRQEEPKIEENEAISPNAEEEVETREEEISEDLLKVEETDLSPQETEPVVEKQANEPKNAPAWLKKSDRLEALKETAIDTPNDEPGQGLDFDEEFVWSAKVLADQGRKPEEVSEGEINWLKRLRQGLGKTRQGLVNQLKSIVGQGPLNKEAVEEIEAILLQADVGIEATDHIIETLQNKLREETLPPDQAIAYLKEIMQDILDRPLAEFESREFVPQEDKFNIWLLTGVNGAGKTTTIGKLAHMAKESGYTCLIAAADTFRAAAVEQVKVWGDRTNTPVIANPGKNTDPAAVVYDGIAAAQSRDVQLLLVDTAGRLQNKKTCACLRPFCPKVESKTKRDST
jgi:fused signal recognition particle receptor